MGHGQRIALGQEGQVRLNARRSGGLEGLLVRGAIATGDERNQKRYTGEVKTKALILAFFWALSGCSPQPQDRPILAAFVRDDCPPCVLMRPWLEEVRGAYGSRLDVAMINADEPGGAGLAEYFGVIAIPSQVYIDRTGRVVELHAGIDTLEGLSKRLAALFEGRRAH